MKQHVRRAPFPTCCHLHDEKIRTSYQQIYGHCYLARSEPYILFILSGTQCKSDCSETYVKSGITELKRNLLTGRTAVTVDNDANNVVAAAAVQLQRHCHQYLLQLQRHGTAAQVHKHDRPTRIKELFIIAQTKNTIIGLVRKISRCEICRYDRPSWKPQSKATNGLHPPLCSYCSVDTLNVHSNSTNKMTFWLSFALDLGFR